MEPSPFDLPIAAARISRLNQATRGSFSIAAKAKPSLKCDLPVQAGPAFTRFSARLSHSRVIREFRVGPGMVESSVRYDARVLPVGRFAE